MCWIAAAPVDPTTRKADTIYEYRATVASIYDADTLRVNIDLGFGTWIAKQNLRLAGIDAPELGTVEGKAARDWLRALLPIGREVVIITERDKAEKYGRYLAHVYLPGGDIISVNEQLVAAGHAKPYSGGARG